MDPPPLTAADRRVALHLGILFALIYFVQGMAEPSEGLIAQPVRSLLNRWSHSPGEISHFMALVSLPWAIKPLYGLMVDFIPLFHSHRRNYLLLATGATSVSLLLLASSVPERGQFGRLLLLLIVPTLGVAFADVVVDAVMVEKGKPLGLTGRLQSIQWAAMYAATVLTGWLGGWLSAGARQDLSFLLCGLGAAVSFTATLIWIHDGPAAALPGPDQAGEVNDPAEGDVATPAPNSFRSHLLIMRQTLMSSGFLLTAAFLFLWNFNPFSSTIQQLHMTSRCGLDEQQYGTTISLFSLASIAACLLYGVVCRRIPASWLLHVSILAGVLSTLTYLGVRDFPTACAASLVAGFAYMLGNLIQMDIAARICPGTVAASFFALLMSVCNIAIIASTSVGGWLYERWSASQSPVLAYHGLVIAGSLATALCWALVPWIRAVDSAER